MKKSAVFVLSLLSLLLFFSACQSGGEQFQGMQTGVDSVSYAKGLIIGQNFAETETEMNEAAVMAGVRDGYAGKGQLSDEQVQQIMAKVNQQAEEKMKQKMEKEGKDFLETNKTAEGVQVHESGLQYIVLEEGNGESPTVADQVVAHYKGTLIDGTVFDSSYDRGQPATFPLGRVVPAWQIALPMMKKGGKMKIFVPHELAYGAQGAGGLIPPYATLIFEIELVDIIKAG